MRERPARVIAVTSGKGGVGKSNVAVNLATAFAMQGKAAWILDADLGLANIDLLLGLTPKFNLSHVIQGEVSIADAVAIGPHGLRVIAGGSGLQYMAHLSDVECAGLIRAFSELTHNIDVLIVDTAAGISKNVSTFCKASQEVLIVACDEPTSLTDAYAMIKVLSRDHGVVRFKVLANMVQGGASGRELFDKLARVTNRFLDVHLEYAGHIPFDDCVKKALQKQRAVIDAFPRSKAAIAFKNLAQRADKWPLPATAAGHIEFFVERLIMANRMRTEDLA